MILALHHKCHSLANKRHEDIQEPHIVEQAIMIETHVHIV